MAYTAQPTGVLATLVDWVQRWANEPRFAAKYPSHVLYPLIQENYRMTFSEVIRLTGMPVYATFTFTITDGTTETLLPYNVGQVERIYEADPNSGLALYEIYSFSRRSPAGGLVGIEGNTLKWRPKWTGGTRTLTVEYVPNGDVDLAFGTQSSPATKSSSTTLVLTTTPSEGYFDRRPNAYVGSYVRLLSAGDAEYPDGYTFFPIQERVITAYDPDNANGPTITVSPAFDFDPSDQEFTSLSYEIVPDGMKPLLHVVAWRTVMTILSMEGNAKRKALAQEEYATHFRDIKMRLANLDATRGNGRFEYDTAIALTDLWGVLV